MAVDDAARLVVFSRGDCALCEEMIGELSAWLVGGGLAVEVRDVDADPVARARFGMKIPVLTLDGRLVCHGRFEAARLEKMLREA